MGVENEIFDLEHSFTCDLYHTGEEDVNLPRYEMHCSKHGKVQTQKVDLNISFFIKYP